MATNYLSEGLTKKHTPGAAVNSGDVVVLTDRVGVALHDIPLGLEGELGLVGEWDVAALSTDDIAEGQEVYWDAANSRATLTTVGNTKMGFAMQASGTGVATVQVKINT